MSFEPFGKNTQQAKHCDKDVFDLSTEIHYLSLLHCCRHWLLLPLLSTRQRNHADVIKDMEKFLKLKTLKLLLTCHYELFRVIMTVTSSLAVHKYSTKARHGTVEVSSKQALFMTVLFRALSFDTFGERNKCFFKCPFSQ